MSGWFFCNECDRALWSEVAFVCAGCGGTASPFGKITREKHSEETMTEKTKEELSATLQKLEYEAAAIHGKIYDAKMHLANALAKDCDIEFDTHRLQDFWGVNVGDVIKRVQVGGTWDGLVSIWFVKKVLNEGHRIIAQIYRVGPGKENSWSQEFASFDAGHFFKEAEFQPYIPRK